MERFQLISNQSPLLIFACLLIGLVYAFLLYQKKHPWPIWVNRALAALRFILVSVICWLLFLNPFIRQILNNEEKPALIFAIDNSQSLANVNDTTELKNILTKLSDISEKLQEDEVETQVQILNAPGPNTDFADINFDQQSSNLSEMLRKIQNNYENRNLDKVVLLSDGIHNQGISPKFLDYNFEVHTIAIGDTTPKKDLKLQSVLANKVAYLGNEFPIVAEIENNGYSNRLINAYLSQNGKILDRKSLTFKNDGELQPVTFYTTAQTKGLQHYVVSIDVLDGEFTEKNNLRDVYLEVIDGKEKILLAAAAPHPDIKAIRSAIENNENYELNIYIPGVNKLKQEKYDLVIFHQIPSIYRLGNDLINQFKNTSKLFILGAQSNFNTFNQANSIVRISGQFGKMDKITPVYNRSFNRFTFEGDNMALIEKLPPVLVPFADYAVSNGSEIILSQRVGNIETEKPLLIVSEKANQKTAVLTGEGIWQWRLEEFARQDSHESFDDLISKLVQYLSTKEDRRRLRVYPINTEFYDFEKVIFETEVYNDIYERIYDQKINLALTNEAGKTSTYTYTTTEGNTRFEISGLPKGIYNYSASAQVQGRSERSSGEFSIKDLQLEALNNTADFNLLQQLSQKSQGKFYLASQLDNLEKDLLATRKPNIIHSKEELAEIINLKWIFFVLMALVALEWFARKYQGSY